MDYIIPFRELIELRPESSYPEDVKNGLNMMAIDDDAIRPIGSFTYRVQKYPGDIDALEVVEKEGRKKLLDYIAKQIKKIVEDIEKSKNHWFLEFKAGIDERFAIPIGIVYDNNNFVMDDKFISTVAFFANKKWMKPEDFNRIFYLYGKGNLTKTDYEIVQKIMRKYNVIRWKANEVLKGEKVLPGNVVIKLKDALTDISKINIEMIGEINGRLADMSNFFILSYIDNGGTRRSINFPQSSLDDFRDAMLETLKQSMFDLYYSEVNYNPFKMLKRYWSYGRLIRDENLIRKIEPIISSDVSLTNQLKSSLGIVVRMLKEVKNPPMNLLMRQLDIVREKMANTFLVDKDEEEYYDTILQTIIDHPKMSKEKIINLLEEIEDNLIDDVNEVSQQFIKANGLEPENYFGPEVNPIVYDSLKTKIEDETEYEIPNDGEYNESNLNMRIDDENEYEDEYEDGEYNDSSFNMNIED